MIRNFNKLLISRKYVRNYSYFEKPRIQDDIAIINLNGPEKMNVLNKNLFSEAKDLFENHIFNNEKIKGIVFISSKKDNFIAGADINMLKNIKSKSEVVNITSEGNKFFNQLRDKNIPLISAINGSCMGGGLEWALYCDYRIATNNKKTLFSLPEVKLGLLPGMGGTYNLPKLVGLTNTLDLILTGKSIKSDKAKKIGLIDIVVDDYELEGEAIAKAKQLAYKKNNNRKKKSSLMDRLEKITIFRNYIFNQAKKKVDKATKGNMPAPYKIIEVLRDNYGKNKSLYLINETKAFADLIDTNESKSLIGIFTGSSEVKKHNYGKPKEVSNLTVLGAGLMGSGIAEVSCNKFDVILKDQTEDAFNNIKIKEDNKNKITFLNDNSKNLDILNNSDFVIEAIYEDLNIKKKVLETTNKFNDNIMFASNTSAIPIEDIAKDSKNPENVIGIHYFSPVQKMPLVEIIPHKGTSDLTISTAYDIVSRQGKTPILVKDVPGFFVNRCLAPLLVEIPELLLQGVKINDIEDAMKEFGMPVGPLTLSDEVGIDISKHVSDLMSKSDLGVRMNGDTSLIGEMIDNNWLGRKSGRGFYRYDGKDKVINIDLINLIRDKIGDKATNIDKKEIQMRLIGKYVNEAVYCLQNNIIKSPIDGDIGSVFGIGFPPHLGGPFRMLDSYGLDNFCNEMNILSEKYGKQFEPAPLLNEYSEKNIKFYN